MIDVNSSAYKAFEFIQFVSHFLINNSSTITMHPNIEKNSEDEEEDESDHESGSSEEAESSDEEYSDE